MTTLVLSLEPVIDKFSIEVKSIWNEFEKSCSFMWRYETLELAVDSIGVKG